jgi:IS30 family transposase
MALTARVWDRGMELAQHKQLTIDTKMRRIVVRLNQRPRKTLGFQTPAAVLEAGIALTA